MDVLFCTSCGRWSTMHNGRMRYSCPVNGAAWCGECYANIKGRSNYRGHLGYRRPAVAKEKPCMALKIPSRPGSNGSVRQPASSSTEYLRDFVNIMEFCCSLSGEGSSKREPGTLSLTTKDGKWTLRVKDPSGKVYAYVTAEKLDDALLTVETGLGDGSLDWRADNDNWKRK